MTDKQLRQAIADAMGGDETDDRTDAVFRGYRATLYASFPGAQRKKSAGWLTTVARVQGALLRSLRAAKRRGVLG
jgi:hypothetical protein